MRISHARIGLLILSMPGAVCVCNTPCMHSPAKDPNFSCKALRTAVPLRMLAPQNGDSYHITYLLLTKKPHVCFCHLHVTCIYMCSFDLSLACDMCSFDPSFACNMHVYVQFPCSFRHLHATCMHMCSFRQLHATCVVSATCMHACYLEIPIPL